MLKNQGSNETLPQPLMYTISGAERATRLSRASIYRAAKAGQLTIYKHGSRSLIRADDLRAFLDGLQPLQLGRAAKGGA